MHGRRNRYEWKLVERKILLTYIKDIDTNVLLQINDDTTLTAVSLLNKYTQSICNNHFWELKIRQSLPGFEFPTEYDNKGRELYLIITNIDLFFERKEVYNLESYYYDRFMFDASSNRIYDDLNRDEISIANWSVEYSKPGLLKSMLKLGAHPDKNYINNAYDDYNIIKTLVDYINSDNVLSLPNKDERILSLFNKNSDIDDIYALFPNSDSILSLPNGDEANIINLLLPFNIINIEDLLYNIFSFGAAKSLQMIIDKKIHLSQTIINLGFIEDDDFFTITDVLLKNKLYPDNDTMNKLAKPQKCHIRENILK